MKNIVIALLVIVIVALGYLQFVKDDSSYTNKTSPASTSRKTIDLSDKGLKELNKDILDDTSVTTLDVSGNNLTGALPAEIRKLTNLEVLNASDNEMTGIPAEIGQLSKLRVANFANNKITGLPLEIGNLRKLETLDLRGNPSVSAYDISQIKNKIPNTKILTD
jgi:Leucine-rich repeat (LRR) protein